MLALFEESAASKEFESFNAPEEPSREAVHAEGDASIHADCSGQASSQMIFGAACGSVPIAAELDAHDTFITAAAPTAPKRRNEPANKVVRDGEQDDHNNFKCRLLRARSSTTHTERDAPTNGDCSGQASSPSILGVACGSSAPADKEHIQRNSVEEQACPANAQVRATTSPSPLLGSVSHLPLLQHRPAQFHLLSGSPDDSRSMPETWTQHRQHVAALNLWLSNLDEEGLQIEVVRRRAAHHKLVFACLDGNNFCESAPPWSVPNRDEELEDNMTSDMALEPHVLHSVGTAAGESRCEGPTSEGFPTTAYGSAPLCSPGDPSIDMIEIIDIAAKLGYSEGIGSQGDNVTPVCAIWVTLVT